jgi:hypothetical protein
LRLERVDLVPNSGAPGRESDVVVERCRAVDVRLALTEQVQIGTVQKVISATALSCHVLGVSLAIDSVQHVPTVDPIGQQRVVEVAVDVADHADLLHHPLRVDVASVVKLTISSPGRSTFAKPHSSAARCGLGANPLPQCCCRAASRPRHTA